MNSILLILTAMFKVLVFFIGSSIVIFLAFMMIQLISYRVFNYNIYKKLNYKFITKELNKKGV